MTRRPPVRCDPARLCVPCGLCCSGVLFAWLPVSPEERWRIEGRGLPVFQNKLGPALTLPCAARTDNGCGIYADRPSVCVEYSCRLLKDCLEGRITLDRAVAIVADVKTALAYAECHLAGEDPRRTIWDRAEGRARRHAADPDSYRRANAELVRHLATLKTLSRRFFKGSSETAQPF
jgi:uncharacterized protein